MQTLRFGTKPVKIISRQFSTMADQMLISRAFDGGSITVSKQVGNHFVLRLEQEPFTIPDNRQHSQYFAFKLLNGKDKDVSFEIENCGDASYPEAWPGYNTCFSYDHENWARAVTTYEKEEGKLQWSLRVEQNLVWFAYAAPYSGAQHDALIARCQLSSTPSVSCSTLGLTVQGRTIDYVKLGTGSLNIWVIARQHPGETLAEYLAEGFLYRLLDSDDAISRKLLQSATLHVVPNMNPDGSALGHLRTNSTGANLNREWQSSEHQGKLYEAPTLERSPEVYHVLNHIVKVGCDAFVDVHMDEEIPANFFAGTQGIPSWNQRLEKLFDEFQHHMAAATPDFQIEKGYEDDEPGKANLSIAGDHIAHRMGCLAVTLEQPYKDTTFNTPYPEGGEYTPQRARKLGESLTAALLAMVPSLQRDKEARQ